MNFFDWLTIWGACVMLASYVTAGVTRKDGLKISLMFLIAAFAYVIGQTLR